jgi:hypothetical protein
MRIARLSSIEQLGNGVTMDIIFIAAIVALTLVTVGLVAGCERLRGRS